MNLRLIAFSLWMVLVQGSILGQIDATATAASQVEPHAASDWIRAHAVAIESAEAGRGFADLEAVGTLVGDADRRARRADTRNAGSVSDEAPTARVSR